MKVFKIPVLAAYFTSRGLLGRRNIHWKTFPEMHGDHNISWRIYQNELSLPKGIGQEQEAYLSNFTDNPIEWFSQYNVKFSPKYFEFVQKKPRESLSTDLHWYSFQFKNSNYHQSKNIDLMHNLLFMLI